MSVGEAQSKISRQEFLDWIVFDRIDPIGRERQDLYFAQLSTIIANSNRDATSKAFKVQDFLIEFGKSEKLEDDSTQKIMTTLNSIPVGKWQ